MPAEPEQTPEPTFELTGEITLWGAHEIRERLGYTREWVQRIIAARNFPPPAATPKAGNLWWPADVEAWIRVHRPQLVDGPISDETSAE